MPRNPVIPRRPVRQANPRCHEPCDLHLRILHVPVGIPGTPDPSAVHSAFRNRKCPPSHPVTQLPSHRPSTTVSLSNARFAAPPQALRKAVPQSPLCVLGVLCVEGCAVSPLARHSLGDGGSPLSPRCLGCFFVRCEIFSPKTTYVRPREVMHIKVCTWHGWKECEIGHKNR